MKKKETSILKPGDIVSFRNVNRIVLNEVNIKDDHINMKMYHIFHPERGVYSAFRDELYYVGHSDKWGDLMKEFESFELSLSKGA